jgi:hypothetical protein
MRLFTIAIFVFLVNAVDSLLSWEPNPRWRREELLKEAARVKIYNRLRVRISFFFSTFTIDLFQQTQCRVGCGNSHSDCLDLCATEFVETFNELDERRQIEANRIEERQWNHILNQWTSATERAGASRADIKSSVAAIWASGTHIWRVDEGQSLKSLYRLKLKADQYSEPRVRISFFSQLSRLIYWSRLNVTNNAHPLYSITVYRLVQTTMLKREWD